MSNYQGAWARIDAAKLPDDLVARIAAGEDPRFVIASAATSSLEAMRTGQAPQGLGTPDT